MVIGPSCSGKSTLIQELTRRYPSTIGPVSGLTSRERRPDDIAKSYRYVEHSDKGLAEPLRKIENGEVVQYAIHSTTGQLYASEPGDYPAAINVLDTMFQTVDGLTKVPFEATRAIGIVTPPELWREWFLKRYPVPSPERSKRLTEAYLCLEWMQQQAAEKLTLVENQPGNIEATAKKVYTSKDTSHPEHGSRLEALVNECYRLARDMI